MRNALTAAGSIDVSYAGQIPLNSEQHLVRRAVQTRRVQRASQIGHEHPITRDIKRESDSFHQMREHDLAIDRTRNSVHRSSTDGIAPRRIAPIAPVEETVLKIQIEVDRLGQLFEQQFDIAA